MKFSVCLPATRATTLGSAIASIRAQSVDDWELLIVGQAEDDEVRAVAENAAVADARIGYIHIEARGTSLARNAALWSSRGEVIAMLDDDCEAAADWLAVIGQCLDDPSNVGLVGGALVAPARRGHRLGNCPSLLPSDALYDPPRARCQAPPGWDWVSANVALRRTILERIGGFDESLGPGTEFPSCEDTDLKLRLERAGVRMRTTPRSVVHHTYGWRYGPAAVLRHQRNYARGNGAMAAKLTLFDDPRGPVWRAEMRSDCLSRWHRRGQMVQLPAGLRRWRHFAAAYDECIRNFGVDARGLLSRNPAAAPAGERASRAVG